MTDAWTLLLSGLAGAALGALFFAGLWWTIRNALTAPQPALWFVSSMVIRSTLALTGFYLVSGGRWDRLLSCVLGFSAARFVVSRLVRQAIGSGPRKEIGHAPQPR
jgi:F1F0 ATPase subunit 2